MYFKEQARRQSRAVCSEDRKIKSTDRMKKYWEDKTRERREKTMKLFYEIRSWPRK